MNIFVQKDFKVQVSTADNKMKKKLQILFLRKELENSKKEREAEMQEKLTEINQILQKVPRF